MNKGGIGGACLHGAWRSFPSVKRLRELFRARLRTHQKLCCPASQFKFRIPTPAWPVCCYQTHADITASISSPEQL
jgi:hypothetical protein